MKQAPIFTDSARRVEETGKTKLPEIPQTDEFGQIIQLAGTICNSPVSLISLIDRTQQWFRFKAGMGAISPPAEITFTGTDILLDHDFSVVEEALRGTHFFDNPIDTAPTEKRYYAGVQLLCRQGYQIGMLCVANTDPYLLSKQQLLGLELLGNHLATLIDLKIARKQLERKSQKIELQNRLQKKMHSVIVHDIRGPIGSILSAFQMLESEQISEEERKMLISIFAKQIGTTYNLVNNLIDWGAIEMQEKSVKQEVNLKEIVDQEFEQIRISAESKNNQLINRVNKTATITINPNILRFMIRNLVSNANKFTHNGQITVYNDVSETYHQVAVSDTGVGMPQEIINKIVSTEDNVVSTSGTNDEKGSGMGITLIKDFMKEIGGQLQIQSTMDKGTTVFLKIPM